jgi:hypothetical protein
LMFLRQMEQFGGVACAQEFGGLHSDAWRYWTCERSACQRKRWVRFDRDGYWRITPAGRAALASASVLAATHNSGEGDPSVMPDFAGADTAVMKNET